MKLSIVQKLLELGYKKDQIFIYNNCVFNQRNHHNIKNANEFYFSWYRDYLYAFLVKLKIPLKYFKKHLFHYNDTISDVIFDSSGFRYGDSWIYSNSQLEIMNDYFAKCKENNCKIIGLPQAYGPFETQEGKKQIEILKKYDLIYARDVVSYNHLKSKIKGMKIYPDFTPLLEIEKTPSAKNYYCIIPNSKMLKVCQYEEYINLFKILIKKIKSYSPLDCFILNHGGKEDERIINQLRKIEPSIKVFVNIDSIEAKKIIANSKFTITSRYHSLISSLSQGVPSISTSWSHKYKIAFEDFGLSSYIIEGFNEADISIKFDEFYSTIESQEKMLNKNIPLLKAKIVNMWNEIKELIQ